MQIFSQKKTTNKSFMYLLAPFILLTLKKFLQPIKNYEDKPFSAQNGPFLLNKICLVKTIIIIFIYLLALFIMQNFKKLLHQIQSYEDAPLLGPKWSICLKEKNFFG